MMGIVEGFDMVPRLTRGSEDVVKWKSFLDAIREQYRNDVRVNFCDNYIDFNAGELPALPHEGYKFLRFSGKVTGQIAAETHVDDYLRIVGRIARSIFGSRVRRWTENSNYWGFYDWRDVHASERSFLKPGDNTTAAILFATVECSSRDDYPIRVVNDKFYEALDIPGKGKGLVARCNIRSGTRIICEKPLLLLPSVPPEELQGKVASQLRPLSKEEQRQFFSLHNNFPGRHALAGIVRTNALPCGSGASIGGVYLEICLINHSCLPNCHNSWNSETQRETIHAIRDILAGEELTISYGPDGSGDPTPSRREHLQTNFGFTCHCELCSLPQEDLQASDNRRRQIQLLDEQIGNSFAVMTEPLKSLQECQALLKALVDEYGADNTVLIPRLYYDAFQVAITHGDEARAKVFAERSYKTRVAFQGEDNPETKRARGFMQNPASHMAFCLGSRRWKTSKTAQPKNLGVDEFEKWLWRDRG
ncbi:hypothetical protein GGR51DRAFT_504756 [Nemania sp. FL0031]|nr:hypothetical protein GGR51DRAFT_504756 [Nemania sp. FL0031]